MNNVINGCIEPVGLLFQILPSCLYVITKKDSCI